MKKKLILTGVLTMVILAVVVIKSNFSHKRMLMSAMIEALTSDEAFYGSCDDGSRNYTRASEIEYITEVRGHIDDKIDILYIITSLECSANGNDGTLSGMNSTIVSSIKEYYTVHDKKLCN